MAISAWLETCASMHSRQSGVLSLGAILLGAVWSCHREPARVSSPNLVPLFL